MSNTPTAPYAGAEYEPIIYTDRPTYSRRVSSCFSRPERTVNKLTPPTKPCSATCCFAKHTHALYLESTSLRAQHMASCFDSSLSDNSNSLSGSGGDSDSHKRPIQSIEVPVQEPPRKKPRLSLYSSSNFGAGIRGGASESTKKGEPSKESRNSKPVSPLEYFAGRRLSTGKSPRGKGKAHASPRLIPSEVSGGLKVVRDESGKATGLLRPKSVSSAEPSSGPSSEAGSPGMSSDAGSRGKDSDDSRARQRTIQTDETGKAKGYVRPVNPEMNRKKKLERMSGRAWVREKSQASDQEHKALARDKGKERAMPDAGEEDATKADQLASKRGGHAGVEAPMPPDPRAGVTEEARRHLGRGGK